MALVLVRIDDRIIHGQVVEGWARPLKIEHILVADDAISQDEMRKMLYCMAVPATVKVSFKTVTEAASLVKSQFFAKERTLVLFASPADVWRFIQCGVELKSVNVGGMHYSEGKRQVLKFISVDADDVRVFRALLALGIEVEGRAVPTDEKIFVANYL